MKNNYRVVPERTPEEEKSYKEISKILDTLRKIQSGELVCVRKKIDTKNQTAPKYIKRRFAGA